MDYFERHYKALKLLRDIENQTLDKEQKELLKLAQSIVEQYIYDDLEKRL